MTAETDALRLVPVCHEIALSNRMKVTLEYDPDGSRTAVLWNEANEPIAEGDAPVLAAAPAVQPAAGREEIEHELIERLLDAQQDINLAANETMRQSLADASQLIDEIEPILRAALSTPDQASEERYKAALEEIVSPVAFMQRRAKADGRQLSGMAYSIANSASYLQGIAKAALYAHPPAQASESGGVDHADIAARLNPDLFSSDERTAHRAASPYAVSIKRAEAVAEVGRVLAAAAALSAPQAAPGD